jgi:hypothetical protein
MDDDVVTLTICTCRVAEELESIVAAVHAGTLDPVTIDFQALADKLAGLMDIEVVDGSDEDSVEPDTSERVVN